MASIKVTYGQTSRKFTIASNTTWKEFESQLHHLFNIPNETAISVSYIDEDGDVITLSTDSELQQILSDQESFGANVKFNVYTSENPDDNNNDWVLEDAEKKDDSINTLNDNETASNKDEEIVAYNIGEPSETDNTEIKQVTNVQTEQQPAVVTDYPHVTVTDEEDDDPLFKSLFQMQNNRNLLMKNFKKLSLNLRITPKNRPQLLPPNLLITPRNHHLNLINHRLLLMKNLRLIQTLFSLFHQTHGFNVLIIDQELVYLKVY
jgi:hypothetical protein